MIANEIIRVAVTADATRIAEMSRIYIEYGLGWSWTTERVEREIRSKNSNVIVALDDAKVIGFAIMKYHEQEARLNLFAIDPDYRRIGLGTRLIHWLEQTAMINGNGVIYLEAREINIAAIRFYESLGYKIVQRIQGYYSGRESAVRMAHDLWGGWGK